MTTIKLTSAQQRVMNLLNAGKRLGVGYDDGDGCRPKTARILEKAGLAVTYATGEFEIDGPYVFITKRKD
jgi:hypothetical protein